MLFARETNRFGRLVVCCGCIEDCKDLGAIDTMILEQRGFNQGNHRVLIAGIDTYTDN